MARWHSLRFIELNGEPSICVILSVSFVHIFVCRVTSGMSHFSATVVSCLSSETQSVCVCCETQSVCTKHNLCVDLKKYVTELLRGFDDNGIFENR